MQYPLVKAMHYIIMLVSFYTIVHQSPMKGSQSYINDQYLMIYVLFSVFFNSGQHFIKCITRSLSYPLILRNIFINSDFDKIRTAILSNFFMLFSSFFLPPLLPTPACSILARLLDCLTTRLCSRICSPRLSCDWAGYSR